MPSARSGSLVAIAFGFAFAAFAYAAMRTLARIVTVEPDPALVIWSEHAGFYWRALSSIFAGIFAALAVALLPQARVARSLPVVIVVAGIALAMQAIFIP